MKKIARVVGRGMPLPRADVDTDQIIPASYLKEIESSGYADGLFAAWRRDPAFVLNDERFRGATILVVGPNFGCGSSREHAVWALRDAGFEAVVSSRLADIFRGNCVRNGILPVTVPAHVADRLLAAVAADPGLVIEVDVPARLVTAAGVPEAFQLEDHARRQLMAGLDDAGLTLGHAAEIDGYEGSRAAWLPRVS